jgi:hypothetical protein
MFPSKDLLFLHFDAHPDLAIPSTTAVEVRVHVLKVIKCDDSGGDYVETDRKI